MVKFSTRKFEASHCKSPRGWGLWGFEANGQVRFAPGPMSFSGAKRWAREAFASPGKVVVVEVAP